MSLNPIDGHAHFFNLKYLPVGGIIKRYVAEGSKYNVSTVIAKSVGKFLVSITASDFEDNAHDSASIPPGMLIPLSLLLEPETTFVPIQDKIHNENLGPADLSADEIAENVCLQMCNYHLLDDDIKSGLMEYVALNQEDFPDLQEYPDFKTLEAISDENSPSEWLTALNGMTKWILKKIEKAESGINNLWWFAFMMKSETRILDRMVDEDSKGVTSFINLTMDVDRYFEYKPGKPAKSHFDFSTRQLSNMKRLKEIAFEKGITLHNFVAFDPSNDESLNTVTKAIDSGYVGVKYYPPMGYSPFYDKILDPADAVKQRNNLALFNWCTGEERSVPIFVHCNNGGFEAHLKVTGKFSNPIHWEPVLKLYPKLRLCLGHAGGTYGWFSEVNESKDHTDPNAIIANDILDDKIKQSENWNNSYAAFVYKLCLEYDNVYCDFSYLDDIVKPKHSILDDDTEEAKQKLLQRLNLLFTANSDFKKKIIYGSDWHMLFRESKNATYFPTYREFFSEDTFGEDFVADFFENNVKVFLDIKA